MKTEEEEWLYKIKQEFSKLRILAYKIKFLSPEEGCSWSIMKENKVWKKRRGYYRSTVWNWSKCKNRLCHNQSFLGCASVIKSVKCLRLIEVIVAMNWKKQWVVLCMRIVSVKGEVVTSKLDRSYSDMGSYSNLFPSWIYIKWLTGINYNILTMPGKMNYSNSAIKMASIYWWLVL